MTVSELLVLLRADLIRLYENDTTVKNSRYRLLLRVLNPRFIPVLLIRFSHYFYGKRLLRPVSFIFSLANVVLFGIEVTPRCEIGPGLLIPHTSGTVIGAHKIGNNAVIFQGVTLGAKEVDLGYSEGQRPTVGDNVIIGSGAKVLGGITVGDNVVIGSNAVVLESVEPAVLVGGIPARFLRKLDVRHE